MSDYGYDDFEDFDDDIDAACPHCDGSGVIITCIDDMCAGGDRCIHGDGEDPCGHCA